MADKRISVDLASDELLEEVKALSKKLGTSYGGVGALAVRFVIPKIKTGELVCVNGDIVPKQELAKKVA